MAPAFGPPDAFFEIERAHAAFEVFELASAQIGSGRPEGPRSQLWGSIVVVSRASLEEALRRVHRHLCSDPACKYTKPQLDPAKFELFLTDHGVQLAGSMPEQLHIGLQRKATAKAGQGTGSKINGPLTSAELLELLQGLNHIRNGYAHRDPKKTETLPPHGAGVLWVAPETGTEWTVQKPHAFSAMRFCHSVFRFVILSCWGLDVAISRRSALPQLLEDNLVAGNQEAPSRLTEQLANYLEQNNLKDALAMVRAIETSILSHHMRGIPAIQPALLEVVGNVSAAALADPVMPDRPSPAVATSSSAVPPSLLDDLDRSLDEKS